MTVFKTYLKILNKCKGPIILFTVILVFFGGFNLKTADNNDGFTATKPTVVIINNDEEIGITKSLIEYIKKNMEVMEIDNSEEAISDALFYREINSIIYIPDNYRESYLSGNTKSIEIKNSGDYQSSYAEMLISKYLKVASIYQSTNSDEDQLIDYINDTLSKEVSIQVNSKVDQTSLAQMSVYYNFLNYSILAGCVYAICLIISSFKEAGVNKRTIVSSTSYKKINRQLLLSNSLFALSLWAIYVILSIILIGKPMMSPNGLFIIINSFVFNFCALTLAFLIGNIVTNKEGISGLINVIALGSSFLCGAFVPLDFLPQSVLTIAHILPSYWYIKSNELIKTMEVFNIDTLTPIITNMLIIIVFSVLFIILTNIISRRKQTIN